MNARLDELSLDGGDLLVYAAAEERDEEAWRLFVSLRIPIGGGAGGARGC